MGVGDRYDIAAMKYCDLSTKGAPVRATKEYSEFIVLHVLVRRWGSFSVKSHEDRKSFFLIIFRSFSCHVTT